MIKDEWRTTFALDWGSQQPLDMGMSVVELREFDELPNWMERY